MGYKEALVYLRKNKNGKIEDLIKACGKDIVNSLELTGVIKRGQEQDRISSYEFTEEGLMIDRYANINDYYKPSFLGKIQNFINQKMFNKQMLSY